MGAITLTPREQNRLLVLNALQQRRCTMAEAAQILGLSPRQLRRQRAAYQARGVAALVHGNRGRPSPRRTPAQTRDCLLRLARAKYAGVNFQHLTHRTRRDRMPQEGLLAQFDGSHHAWLEDRGPALVLHAGVDDATSKIIGAYFDEEETTAGYFRVVRQAAEGPGLPLAAYTDHHSIFVGAPRQPLTLEEQLQGQRTPTQLGRVFQELGIQWIPASSPQAKGRIERLFGALQDRLVAELRMAGIREKEAANAFLPGFIARYNARFAKPAAHAEPVYHPWPAGVDPDTIFCFKYVRTVANDHTVTLGPDIVQIVPHGRSYAKARVEIHERLDGTLAVVHQGHSLPITRLTTPAVGRVGTRRGRRLNPAQLPAGAPAQRRRPRRPSRTGKRTAFLTKPRADHPWRRYDQEQRLKAARRRTKSLIA
jgi:hypothetical protein